jgi:hypothetical protein
MMMSHVKKQKCKQIVYNGHDKVFEAKMFLQAVLVEVAH